MIIETVGDLGHGDDTVSGCNGGGVVVAARAAAVGKVVAAASG